MAGRAKSDPMPARHVFKFVVSGTEFSEEQQQAIQARVAQAGIEAIADLDVKPRDTFVLRDLEWLGIWIHMIQKRDAAIELPSDVLAKVRDGSSLP
jgi:hypothetical protein